MPERKSFLIRIDPALWTEIERLAHAELRSVNAQIEYLLREALARRRRHPHPDHPLPSPLPQGGSGSEPPK